MLSRAECRGLPGSSTYITQALYSPSHRLYITHYATLEKSSPISVSLDQETQMAHYKEAKVGAHVHGRRSSAS